VEVIDPEPGTPFPILNLIGGKWTSFRAFSEQVTDRVLDFLGVHRLLTTENTPIGGGVNYPKNGQTETMWVHERAVEYDMDTARMRTLFERYGTHAEKFASFITAGDDSPLSSRPEYSKREVIYIAQKEIIIHLDDFVLRRSMLGKLGMVDRDVLVELADIIGEELAWDAQRRESEIQRTVAIFTDEHRVIL
jgi:glycerol-3-phosphate dehydrogenase